MKIIIPGGSGHVGMVLSRAFTAAGHEVVILGRGVANLPFRVVEWDVQTIGPWADEFNGAEVVINLAGSSVNCRYNSDNRRAIIDSRLRSTTVVGQAIARSTRLPKVWLQMSTATIYTHRYDAANDEASGILGGGEPGAPNTWRFSIDVAKAWEEATTAARLPHTRTVLLRTALTLSLIGAGCLMFCSGWFGVDLVEPAVTAVSSSHGSTKPTSYVRSAGSSIMTLMALSTCHRQTRSPTRHSCGTYVKPGGRGWDYPPAPGCLSSVRFFCAPRPKLILKSRRVIPTRLLKSGFDFAYPEWSAAAVDLCQRWRKLQRKGR